MSMLLMVAAMKAKLGNPIRKLVLIKLADNANDDGICWPSYRHIADQCEIDRKTAIRHVEWLEENKFLSKQYRKDDERGNKSNVYRIDIAGGIAHLVAQNTQPGGRESPPPSGTESPRTSHSFEPINEPVISGTSADAPCSVCGGTLFVGAGIECHRCNGTGKEPNTDQPVDLAHSQDTPVPESKAAKGSAAKPKKPRTDAEKLINLVKSKPELCVCLNCIDDDLLTEWAKLRVKMKASDSDRALRKIESALEELRTVHRIAPDIAIEMQCDKGWRGLEVDWVLNNLNQNRPNMSYAGNQQPAQNRPRQDAPKTFKQASEVDSESLSNGKNAISNLKVLI